MATNTSNPESGPARLKDTPRPEDLDAVTSPAARLLTWLRSWSFALPFWRAVAKRRRSEQLQRETNAAVALTLSTVSGTSVVSTIRDLIALRVRTTDGAATSDWRTRSLVGQRVGCDQALRWSLERIAPNASPSEW